MPDDQAKNRPHDPLIAFCSIGLSAEAIAETAKLAARNDAAMEAFGFKKPRADASKVAVLPIHTGPIEP